MRYEECNSENTLGIRKESGTERIVEYSFFCPGCEMYHAYNVDETCGNPVWDFNGNIESPTFSPSLLAKYRYGHETKDRICHLYLRQGIIQYLNDCTHKLAGMKIKLPKLPHKD